MKTSILLVLTIFSISLYSTDFKREDYFKVSIGTEYSYSVVSEFRVSARSKITLIKHIQVSLEAGSLFDKWYDDPDYWAYGFGITPYNGNKAFVSLSYIRGFTYYKDETVGFTEVDIKLGYKINKHHVIYGKFLFSEEDSPPNNDVIQAPFPGLGFGYFLEF